MYYSIVLFILSVCLLVSRQYGVKSLPYIPSFLQNIFQNLATNYRPLSKSIDRSNPSVLKTYLINSSASCSAIQVFRQAIRRMSFVSLSTTTSTTSQPFDYSRSVIKSIKRSSYALSSTRRGQSILQGICFPTFVLQQIQQFQQKRSMSFRIDAQQQFRKTNSSVFDRPRQPTTRASYTSQMIYSWSSGQSRTYSCS